MYRILVVEDEDLVAKTLASILREAGYRATWASDFERGRELLVEEPPDLLITDVRLGAFNGLQLLVRARMQYPDMPGIVLTGFPDPVLAAEAEYLGAVYLLKPVHAHTLQQEVRRLLRGRRPRRRWARKLPAARVDVSLGEVRGRIVSASYAGMSVEADVPPVAEHTIEVYVPAIDRSLPGRVIWERRAPGSKTARIGIELQSAPPETMRMWRALVDSIPAEDEIEERT